MPVTAKLSKLFYDRLGEEIAQELVDWFNSVDYSGNLRHLNELTLARFDAKLEHRIGMLETKLTAALARLEAKIDRLQ
jgi:hypothetical protein